MKKFFAIAAMAAMLIACGDNGDDNKKPGPGNEPEEPEFVSAITIDGQFGDWAALDASKVVEATLPEGETKYGDLKKVKIYADDLYIYVYYESNEPDPASVYHIDLCINIDNDEMTGGYANVWSNAGVDYLIEGAVYSEGAFVEYGGEAYPWSGEIGAEGWSWDTAAVIAGACKGMGTAAGYEIQVTRDMLPLDFGASFTMGVGLSKDWGRCGLLPCNVISEEDPAGLAPQFNVTINYAE